MSTYGRVDPWAEHELSDPGWQLVTLVGGPLNGLRRHVRRTESQAWFRHPEGTARYRYARHDQESWHFGDPRDDEQRDRERFSEGLSAYDPA